MRPSSQSTPFNRRGFIKTSVLAATSLAILSTGTAIANPASGSSSGGQTEPIIIWVLKVIADPYFTQLDELHAPTLDPVYIQQLKSERARGKFKNVQKVKFDPVGPGDDSNTYIKTTLFTTQAPSQGQTARNFTFRFRQTANLVLNKKPVVTLNEDHDLTIAPEQRTGLDGDGKLAYEPLDVQVSITINQAGDIIHIDGGRSLNSSKGLPIGSWNSSLNVQRDRIHAEAIAQHSFDSAYTVEGGLSLALKEILQVSGQVAVNTNFLEAKKAVASLTWTIVKVKQLWKLGANAPYYSDEYPL